MGSRKLLKTLLLSAAMLVLIMGFGALFSEPSYAASQKVIHVKASDGAHGIQQALKEARLHATDAQPYRIVVPAGHYVLTSALHIYSNTELYSEPGTRYTGARKDNLLKIGTSGKDTDATGFYYRNITIDGGIWDRTNLVNSTGMKLVHAKNVNVRNAEFCNSKNSHLIETAAVDGLHFSNCYFHDAISTVKNDYGFECIQIDILAKRHINGYSRIEDELDCVSRNISVDRCRFQNVVRSIGSHTAVIGKPFRNIKLTNNTITGCKDAGFYFRNAQNITISNNRIQCRSNGIALFNMSYTNKGYYLSKANGIHSKKALNVNGKITGNTISTSNGNGIFLLGRRLTKRVKSDHSEYLPAGDYPIENITVSGNIIRVSGSHLCAVQITDGRNISLRSNYIPKTSRNFYAFYINDGSRNIRIDRNTLNSGCLSAVHTYNRVKAATNTITSLKYNRFNVKGARFGIYIKSGRVTGIAGNKVTGAKKKSWPNFRL